MKITLFSLMLVSSFIPAHGIKCRICDDAELSPNNNYYAGHCNEESDFGTFEEKCPFEDSQYCLKLKTTFNSDLKRETDLYEKNFLNDELMKSVFTRKEREELKKSLEAQKSVYTKHGTLRGCAKMNGNFADNQNCTTIERGGYKLVTCLCNDSDYCNRCVETATMSILVIIISLILWMSNLNFSVL